MSTLAWRRLPLMAIAILALLAAVWGGLLRSGWHWPTPQPSLPLIHGPLIIGGFLGTLIGLERAVALRRRWAWLAPLFGALGAVALILSGRAMPGALLLTLSSLALVAVFGAIIRHQPALFTAVLGLGAVAWLVGNLLWLAGRALPLVVPWWSSFLVITIVGERLELSRMLRLTPWRSGTFLAALALLAGGLIISLVAFDLGMRIVGAGQLALAAWLGRYDLARRTVRKSGLTRFVALALLLGYGWLAIGGLLGLAWGGALAGSAYDAQLHSVLIGFVISMIFGHAPIIFPAVLSLTMSWDRSAYLPLVVLHLSLLLRIGGDVIESLALRRWGALFNAVAILLFLGNTTRLARRGRQPAGATRSAVASSGAPRLP
ncbi:hypothetical protein [Kallotenue papyrolyticum]|uniref:hypothetical protein n=1 Tax=Kallotenue papyrolyticum TaxID=1325125 RepID=UPI0004925A2D|nr:hypothetical protein [Kallotenue papyrolyticum]